MKTLPIGEFKAQFSDILDKVKAGESFGILYGRKKIPVAMLVPFEKKAKAAKRKIGLLDNKVTIKFSKNFEVSETDLLEMQ